VAGHRFDRLDRFSDQRTELTFPHFNRYNDKYSSRSLYNLPQSVLLIIMCRRLRAFDTIHYDTRGS